MMDDGVVVAGPGPGIGRIPPEKRDLSLVFPLMVMVLVLVRAGNAELPSGFANEVMAALLMSSMLPLVLRTGKVPRLVRAGLFRIWNPDVVRALNPVMFCRAGFESKTMSLARVREEKPRPVSRFVLLAM
jgi:hypothetical protein